MFQNDPFPTAGCSEPSSLMNQFRVRQKSHYVTSMLPSHLIQFNSKTEFRMIKELVIISYNHSQKCLSSQLDLCLKIDTNGPTVSCCQELEHRLGVAVCEKETDQQMIRVGILLCKLRCLVPGDTCRQSLDFSAGNVLRK